MILSTAQIANYMEIFSTLAEKDAPCTVAELAEPTKADTVFTGEFFVLESRRLLKSSRKSWY